MLLDNAGLTQDPEVVRGGGLGNRQLERAACLVIRTTCELVDDLPSHWIGQRGEHRIQLHLTAVGVGEGAHL